MLSILGPENLAAAGTSRPGHQHRDVEVSLGRCATECFLLQKVAEITSINKRKT